MDGWSWTGAASASHSGMLGELGGCWVLMLSCRPMQGTWYLK